MDTTLPTPDSAAPTQGLDPAASMAALLSRALGALLGRGGILVVSFGFAVLVARTLDPAARGDFALIQATNGLTVVLANFAIGGAVVYHVGRRRMTSQRAVGAATALALLSSGAGALVLIPVALALRSRLFPDLAPILVAGAVLLATPLLLREYMGGILIALGRPQRYVLSHAAQPAAASVALAAILFAGVGSLTAVVAGWAIGVTLSGLTALVMAFTLVGSAPRMERDDLVTLGRFGVRTYPALLARFLNLRLDQFLVRLLASAAVLGQYAVAVNVGELLIQVPVVLLWALSGAISSADPEESREIVAQFCRVSILLLLGLAVVIAAAVPTVLPLVFGGNYRPAVPSVLLLLPGMVCYAPAIIFAEYFVVQGGMPGRAALIPAVSLVVSTVMNFPLTPALGAAGASMASSISYAVMLVTAVVLFASHTHRSPVKLLRITRADLTLLVGVLWRGRRA